jgi:hypothetical protein
MSDQVMEVCCSALGAACRMTAEIYGKWQSLGGEKSFLGCPAEDTASYRNGGCSVRFQKGSIYHHPASGTYYMQGRIYRYWADQLGIFGPYGFPAGDPQPAGASADGPARIWQQEFEGGTLNESQPEIRDGSDLRGEIARRGIGVRDQGQRPTCSVHTMVFLMEYQYTGLLGRDFSHLSVEYANHAANLAEDLRNDGQYFSSVAAGYEKSGIIKEMVWPYRKEWAYDYDQACGTASDDMICLGRRMLAGGHRLHGRFIKEHGAAGLSGSQFDEMLACLDDGIPVAVGRDHSMALVGYRRDPAQPGGGIMIFRNSHGTSTAFTGYQTETFDHVRQTVFDVYVYDVD